MSLTQTGAVKDHEPLSLESSHLQPIKLSCTYTESPLKKKSDIKMMARMNALKEHVIKRAVVFIETLN